MAVPAYHVQFTGFHPEVAKTIVTHLETRIGEYPEIRDRLQLLGSLQERNRIFHDQQLADVVRRFYTDQGLSRTAAEEKTAAWIAKNLERNNRTYAQASTDPLVAPINGIVLYDFWARNPRTLRYRLRKNVLDGVHPIGCDTIEALIDHEIAHHLDAIYGLSQRAEIKEMYEKTYKYEDVASGLSRYARGILCEAPQSH